MPFPSSLNFVYAMQKVNMLKFESNSHLHLLFVLVMFPTAFKFRKFSFKKSNKYSLFSLVIFKGLM